MCVDIGSLFWLLRYDSRVVRQLRRELELELATHRIKSRFLATVSHGAFVFVLFLSLCCLELRTPMNSVIALTDELQRVPLSNDQQDMLAGIADSGMVMMRLIEDILLLAKIEAGKFELAPSVVHLHDLMRSVGDSFLRRYHAKGLSLSSDLFDTPRLIYVDGFRLRQVGCLFSHSIFDLSVVVLLDSGQCHRQCVQVHHTGWYQNHGACESSWHIFHTR